VSRSRFAKTKENILLRDFGFSDVAEVVAIIIVIVVVTAAGHIGTRATTIL